MSRAATVAAAALVICACRDRTSGRVVATGTVEVTEIDVAPMVPARVVRVLADEGEPVRRGDTVATLTQTTTRADIAQREARVRAAQAAFREASAGPRPQELERARAELALSEAEAARAAQDLPRIERLAASGTVSRQALDAARAAARAGAARRAAAQESLRLLEAGTRREQVQAARAELAAARAALDAVRAVAEDLVLTAPVSGVVLSRNAEPGEVMAAGQSALTLGDTAHPFARVYVATPQLPRVRTGQSATARLDGFPDRPIPGTVVAISAEAEFTPRVALTERERADLLFGVKVALRDTTGLLRPGLPATIELHVGDAR